MLNDAKYYMDTNFAILLKLTSKGNRFNNLSSFYILALKPFEDYTNYLSIILPIRRHRIKKHFSSYSSGFFQPYN